MALHLFTNEPPKRILPYSDNTMTFFISLSAMVLLRPQNRLPGGQMAGAGRRERPEAGRHTDKNAGSVFEQRKALAPKGRGPWMGRVTAVLPTRRQMTDRKVCPEGVDFACREPGLPGGWL